MPKLARIKQARTGDLVFEALRDSILGEVFLPGQRLSPDELAARLGVSLTPIKEAIARLATEGLIVIKPRSGTFVADISPEDVAETFEIRAALESLAAERLAPVVTADDLRRFRALVAAMERPVTSERQRVAHDRANTDFHDLLVERAGNNKLRQLYRSLRAHMTIARVHYSRRGWSRRMASERDEHRRILEALEARDAPRLVRAVRQHIGRAAQSLVADLREQPPREDASR
jgi:DNA-binding GntR family transcriptional regulator